MAPPETYIVRRTDKAGGYLTPAGSERSYTRNPLKARRFPSRTAALLECCGNEKPVNLLDVQA